HRHAVGGHRTPMDVSAGLRIGDRRNHGPRRRIGTGRQRCEQQGRQCQKPTQPLDHRAILLCTERPSDLMYLIRNRSPVPAIAKSAMAVITIAYCCILYRPWASATAPSAFA